MDYIILKYIHFTGIFGVVGTLVAEVFMVRSEMTRMELRRVARIDGLYGLAAILTTGAGLTLWLSDIGKPPEFYSNGGLIYVKLALFIVIGLMSIYPTIFFTKNRFSSKNLRSEERIYVPTLVLTIIRVEIGLLLLMPLLAGMMAQGRNLLGGFN